MSCQLVGAAFLSTSCTHFTSFVKINTRGQCHAYCVLNSQGADHQFRCVACGSDSSIRCYSYDCMTANIYSSRKRQVDLAMRCKDWRSRCISVYMHAYKHARTRARVCRLMNGGRVLWIRHCVILPGPGRPPFGSTLEIYPQMY
jgi:hypothetical protein